MMYRVLNIALARFYAWLHNPVSAHDKDNQRLLMLIHDSYSFSGLPASSWRSVRNRGDLRKKPGESYYATEPDQNRVWL